MPRALYPGVASESTNSPVQRSPCRQGTLGVGSKNTVSSEWRNCEAGVGHTEAGDGVKRWRLAQWSTGGWRPSLALLRCVAEPGGKACPAPALPLCALCHATLAFFQALSFWD